MSHCSRQLFAESESLVYSTHYPSDSETAAAR
jgi:hypothetical protein